MTTINESKNGAPVSTGIPGLDEILCGGLTRERLYLVEGEPGTGKTTLALQFLAEGARNGEAVLYLTLAESESELRAVAASHGWNLDGIHIREMVSAETMLAQDQHYTMFHPSEVELGATTREIMKVVEEIKPTRLVLDSLSELQLLSENALRYRRQVLAFKQFFVNRNCTVILLDDRASSNGDLQVRSIAHGVITLQQSLKDYGAERRRLRVVKYRGVAFRGGMHDYTIHMGGLVVYPRLVAAASRYVGKRTQVSSGVPDLDQLLGGGLEQGTSTLIAGPAGTGKSSLATQFVAAANRRGERAAMFLFEESANNLLNRTDALNMNLHQAMESGLLSMQQIDPAEMAPGEFAAAVCAAADEGARVIVLDSLNGYLNAMPDERFLITHLHELLTYLGQRGVVTLLVSIQQGMFGGSMASAVDASYLADNVVILRYFEMRGEVRRAISVFKKRGSAHERTIRTFALNRDGIKVGPVLRDLHGILTGVPTVMDDEAHDGVDQQLMD